MRLTRASTSVTPSGAATRCNRPSASSVRPPRGAAMIWASESRAYDANPEFAAFYRSLQAYRKVLGREGDILVIQPDGEFYKYLRDPAHH